MIRAFDGKEAVWCDNCGDELDFDAWLKQEDERIEALNKKHRDRSVVVGFMAGKYDGRCPRCGGSAEADDSDEGTGDDHWLERYWTCDDCGAYFTERFMCVPIDIWLTDCNEDEED